MLLNNENTANRKAPDNSFIQINNFLSGCDRKTFSNPKRRYQTCRNARWMKSNNDECARKEDMAKRGKVNTEFMKKHNLLENYYQEDWFKNFLENELSKTHNHSADLQSTCANVKGLISSSGHEARL